MSPRISLILLLLTSLAAAPAPTQPATTQSLTTQSATKPVAMKPISAAEEATYSATLVTRAQAVLDDLKLTDQAKADHVKAAVIAQYRGSSEPGTTPTTMTSRPSTKTPPKTPHPSPRSPPPASPCTTPS